MMSALFRASARLNKLWILCVNDLLDGTLCKNFFYFHIFLFFWFSNMILSHALIFHFWSVYMLINSRLVMPQHMIRICFVLGRTVCCVLFTNYYNILGNCFFKQFNYQTVETNKPKVRQLCIWIIIIITRLSTYDVQSHHAAWWLPAYIHGGTKNSQNQIINKSH